LDNVREVFAELGTLTYELIVIDDFSADDSPHVIAQYLEI
jgi:hypothetical protein